MRRPERYLEPLGSRSVRLSCIGHMGKATRSPATLLPNLTQCVSAQKYATLANAAGRLSKQIILLSQCLIKHLGQLVQSFPVLAIVGFGRPGAEKIMGDVQGSHDGDALHT